MQQTKSDSSRFWPFFAIAVLLAIVGAAIHWSLGHPYGIHWDEASYVNEAWIDAQLLRYGMLHKLGGRILLGSWGRPPAYRLLADPFLAVLGLHITVARSVSLACFALSSWFIYSATRQVGSKAAGAFAVLVFGLSPEVVSASIFFGTDAPLYLAVSAMLYFLFVTWGDRPESARGWIGLGLSIGLGLMAKASFVVIAFPPLLFWFVLGRRKGWSGPSLAAQFKAGALALCIAAPWWVLNVKSVVAYSRYARGFVRNSLGPPSPETWARWLNTVFQCLLGYGLTVVIVSVLVAGVATIIVRKRTILNSVQKAALTTCACAGLPIVVVQLSGTNHLLRHISPVMIPLAISIGMLADKTGWIRSRAGVVVSCAAFGAQSLMLVYPVLFPNTSPVNLGFVNGAPPWRVMVRFDQWDWKPVREISDGCSLASPKIGYLGGGREFDPPAIQYPWIAAATATRATTIDLPDVTWLWRYEDGTIDWQKVMDGADQSDIVFTAPRYVGEVENKEDLDNQYNAEFADRLSRDPGFRGPIRFEMGRFEPVEMDVFLKKTLVCSAGQAVPAGASSEK
ncbi:MAG: glycosyltransferase family 39 protein [Candidatus Acidiferrales bacterium]